MKYLLDTNVLREIGKTAPHPNVASWLSGINDCDLAISALTVREVTLGIEKLRPSKPEIAEAIAVRMSGVFDAFAERILTVDRPVAEAWGQMLAGSGKHIDDAGLAATALVHRLVLVTRNTRDLLGRGVEMLDPFRFPPLRRPGKIGKAS